MTEKRNALRLASAAYCCWQTTPVDKFTHISPEVVLARIHDPKIPETSNAKPLLGNELVDCKRAHLTLTPTFTNGGVVSVSARTTDDLLQWPAMSNTATSTSTPITIDERNARLITPPLVSAIPEVRTMARGTIAPTSAAARAHQASMASPGSRPAAVRHRPTGKVTSNVARRAERRPETLARRGSAPLFRISPAADASSNDITP